MAKLAKLQIEGFEELVKTFEKADEKVKKKALRPALRAGAKVIKDDAKKRAHKRSGRNAKYIKVKSLKRSRRQIGVTIQTGTRAELQIPKDQNGYYPFTEEYGSKNHEAHPYMRPALATKRTEAIRTIADHLENNLDKILTKSSRTR